MTESEVLTAQRNGLTQTFTRRQWEIMGTDKYGWELIPETPKEVAGLAVKAHEEKPSLGSFVNAMGGKPRKKRNQ